MSQSPVLDANGQPISIALGYKRNKAKAVLTLKGIIEGIHCDEKINETELLFLRAWKDSDFFNFNDGDFIDIHEQIEDILEDSLITMEEKSDILNMLDDIIDYGGVAGSEADALANQLLGFLNGISADNHLNDTEIHALLNILKSSSSLSSRWPGNALKIRLDETLADGVIDDNEREDLLNLVKAVSGQKLFETGLAYGLSADFSTCDSKQLHLGDMSICFTGTFLSGNRDKQQLKAQELGAKVAPRVTKSLDVLVLGSLASRDWKFSSYGRKIESVLSNRQSGSTTEIINEETWNELVDLHHN